MLKSIRRWLDEHEITKFILKIIFRAATAGLFLGFVSGSIAATFWDIQALWTAVLWCTLVLTGVGCIISLMFLIYAALMPKM